MTMPVAFDRFLLVTLVVLVARVLPAAELSSVDSAATAADQLKALNDQTIIVSHVWLDTEWDQFNDGAEKATWTLGGVWGWRVSKQQDWAMRLKVPFLYDRSDESSGHADSGGLGDIEVAAGTAYRLSKTWRTGGGIELHADTASNPALGDSVWRLHSSWSVAHDVTSWLTLTPTAEYSHSVAEEHIVAPQRYLDLSLPASFILPHNWSISTNYRAEVDFENGDRCTHAVDLGLAKRLSNIPIVLSATLEKQLDGSNKRFQANFTMTYYFERYHTPN
ncbi:MAG: hypothetical protein WA183_00625 [Chthoniobacterales bacterium]